MYLEGENESVGETDQHLAAGLNRLFQVGVGHEQKTRQHTGICQGCTGGDARGQLGNYKCEVLTECASSTAQPRTPARSPHTADKRSLAMPTRSRRRKASILLVLTRRPRASELRLPPRCASVASLCVCGGGG